MASDPYGSDLWSPDDDPIAERDRKIDSYDEYQRELDEYNNRDQDTSRFRKRTGIERDSRNGRYKHITHDSDGNITSMSSFTPEEVAAEHRRYLDKHRDEVERLRRERDGENATAATGARSQAAANRLGDAERGATGASPLNDGSLAKGGLVGAEHGNWSTNVAAGALSHAGVQGKALSKAMKFLSNHKEGTGIAGLAIGVLVLIGALLGMAGANELGTISQMYQGWMTNLQSGAEGSRMTKVLRSMLYGSTSTCSRGPLICKYQSYQNGKTADRLKESGFDVETDPKTNKLKSLSYVDAEGKRISVTRDNFTQLARSDPIMRANIERFASTRAGLFRNKFSLAKWKLRGITRDIPKGDGTAEGNQKAMRNKEYGVEDGPRTTEGDPNAVDSTDETTRQAMADAVTADADIQNEATQLRSETLANGKPASAVPDLSSGSLSSLAQDWSLSHDVTTTVKQGALGTVKGAVMGVFADIDNYCMVYAVSRGITLGAKVYIAIQLMRYAATVFSAGDKQTAGDVAQTQDADGNVQPSTQVITDALNRPSTNPDTAGQTFNDAAGFQLMSQGQFGGGNGAWNALTQYVTGGWFLRFLLGLMTVIGLDFGNINVGADLCNKEQSFGGQALLMVGGIVTSIFSGGAGAIKGAASGLIRGLIIAGVLLVVTPLLVNILAGVVAPDWATDPGGGVSAANATYGGASIMGQQIHATQGEMPTTETTTNQILGWTTEDRQTIAEAQQIENQRLGVWNLDNPMSVPNHLALQLQPLGTGSVVSRVASMFGLVAKLPGNLLSLFGPPAYAAESGLAFYRGDLCDDDDYVAMNLARTASCGLVYMPDPSLVNPSYTNDAGTGKYDPDQIQAWMTTGEHCTTDGNPVSSGGTPVNCVTADEDPFAKAVEEPSLLKSMVPQEFNGHTQFESFLIDCAYSDSPVSQDGYPVSISDRAIDYCWSNNDNNAAHLSADILERLTYFRGYAMDQGSYDTIAGSDDGTLGQVPVDTYTGGIPGAVTNPTTANAPAATASAAIAQTATEMGQWGGTYLWSGGHGSLDDLKQRIQNRFQGGSQSVCNGSACPPKPNGNGVDCAGFVRAVVYQATGVDMGLPVNTSKYVVEVAKEQAQPGDIFVIPEHTGVIVANDPSSQKFTTVEAHNTKSGINGGTQTYQGITGVYRFTGGSN